MAELPGLIFTYVWAFDDPADRTYVDWLTEPVRSAGGRLDFVELCADQDTRLAREVTELRLKHKRSMQNLEASRQRLLDAGAAHQLSTSGEFFYPNPAPACVDSTHLTPAQAAERIAEHLRITVGQGGPPVG